MLLRLHTLDFSNTVLVFNLVQSTLSLEDGSELNLEVPGYVVKLEGSGQRPPEVMLAGLLQDFLTPVRKFQRPEPGGF